MFPWLQNLKNFFLKKGSHKDVYEKEYCAHREKIRGSSDIRRIIVLMDQRSGVQGISQRWCKVIEIQEKEVETEIEIKKFAFSRKSTP